MISIIKNGLIIVAIIFLYPAIAMASLSIGYGKILWVIDGDTYQISLVGAPEGQPVRARHFDTPEQGERAQCAAEREKAGQASAFARRLLPRGAVVGLSDFGRDRYGRLLATITLADGTDLAGRMIGTGLAHAYEGGRKPGWCAPLGAP